MSPKTIRGRRWTTAFLLAFGALLIGSVFGVASSGQAASDVAPPVNSAPPTISGTPQVGSTLTTSDGTWTGASPITYTYQWSRCDQNGGSCSTISGATANTYLLKQVDVGTTLRSTVIATNSDGTAQATSVPTALITAPPAPPAPPVTGCPSGTGAVQVADVTSPARLLIDQQTTTPSLIVRTTSQLTAHFRVTACGGRPVQGALVYVTAVPYNQFSIPPEATTAADGTVNVTMTQLSGFPAARRQQLLVMFVRARKPGEDPLAGISTRLLVSFPVSLNG
ncbi:MAG TPA: hypothetical protein VMU73_04870 [Gaiellaceae bacterium]|nr:hypothetical protein [Gaiellaceae bacterium]